MGDPKTQARLRDAAQGLCPRGPHSENRSAGRTTKGGLALIVDDEENARALLADLLSQAGFRCLEAADGEQALELLSRSRPHLAVVDVALPGISGAELGWRMRRSLPKVPMVVVSGRLQDWDVDDLADLGFNRVFSKPLDCDRFVRACRELCEALVGTIRVGGPEKILPGLLDNLEE